VEGRREFERLGWPPGAAASLALRKAAGVGVKLVDQVLEVLLWATVEGPEHLGLPFSTVGERIRAG